MAGPRLEGAASLYLRQHAGDPVAWFPWGPEAFREARTRDVPIFLSSGYSACHWCHVMQAESFRDPETARAINELFVPIKVDRELRPDVDALYMDYVTATTGRGGWPMSVFLAPDLTPLFGATYLPPEPRPGLPSLLDVLNEIDAVYRGGGEDLERVRAASLAFLREQAGPRPGADVGRDVVDAAAEYAVRLHDSANGGFGPAPKFPHATLLRFLCAYHSLVPDSEIVWVVSRTVSAMLRGGIYDQAGGGLFRYATDNTWSVPHFEKMLYDSAQLLGTLAAASRVIEDPALLDECARAVRQTAGFLGREMGLEGGGYAASLSADQGGVEGAAYMWSYAELAGVLRPYELELAVAHLGVDEGVPEAPSVLTRRSGRSQDADAVDDVLARILEARAARPAPELDPKLVTSWNALAARGLLEAGAAFEDAASSSAGLDVLGVLLDRCATPSGVLRVPDDPSVSEVRIVDDAALLASACITAYDTTGDPAWVEHARAIQSRAIDDFADGTAIFMVADATDLPVRPREQSDEPTPSGAATLIDNAVRLAAITGDPSGIDFARGSLRGLWMIADFAPEHAGATLEAATRMAALGL